GRAHGFEDGADLVAWLGGVGWPVRDAHRTLGKRTRGEERGRVGEIRFDDPVHGLDRAGVNRPGRVAGGFLRARVDVDARLGEHVDRQVDVGLAGYGGTGVDDAHAVGEAGADQ